MTSGGQEGPTQRRRMVGPHDKPTLADRIWPRRHGRYWVSKRVVRAQSKNVEFIAAELARMSLAPPSEELALASVVAQTAIDRAAAADRRASTIAGTVAVSASLTVSGGGLALDQAKWSGHEAWRTTFGIFLCLAVLAFTLAAVFSLRALASYEGRGGLG